MARDVQVNLKADTGDFESGMKSAASSVDRLESNLKSADSAASRFDGGLDRVNGSLDNSTGKFRGTADLAGGLGNVLGIEALGQAEAFATGMADIADGLGTLLAPALTKAKAAFVAMNATLMANPIFLVVAALTALTVAFVIAYKKSETFRNIVNGAFSAIKDFVMKWTLPGLVIKHIDTIMDAARKIADPFIKAFDAIVGAWNNTVGRLSLPDLTPGFDVPGVPFLADGGVARAGKPHVVGERGPELFVPNVTGTVVPNHMMGGGGTARVEIAFTGDAEMVALMRKSVRTRGGNVQVVLGS